ncbi:MAG: DUF6807 family protein [Bacteroidota bacterium]
MKGTKTFTTFQLTPLLLLSVLNILMASCGSSTDKGSPFSFEEKGQGVELFENGKAVFFYQKEPKSLTGAYICNNYIHPLYTLNGDTITEEFPVDHPYHRGIFWSWHQLYINNQSIGDGWIMEEISQEVVEMEFSTTKNSATLKLNVLWKSLLLKNEDAFIVENTTIIVHQLKSGLRRLDFEISLQALVPGVSIGGSDDEKGYGGLCARIKLPEDLLFTSTEGSITPKRLQVIAGPWMDFSGTFSAGGEQSGLTIFCHPDTPNYPAPWILRQKSSMQNIVFPGRERVEIAMDQPTILKYSLIVHAGNADNVDLVKFQLEDQ